MILLKLLNWCLSNLDCLNNSKLDYLNFHFCYKKGFAMLMFSKIVTENQAEELVEFVTKKFQSVDTLKDWLNPISDELGIIRQVQYTIHCPKNDKNKRKQRNFLRLNFGENKNIIFVGDVYENWHDNAIFGIVDFSEEQNHVKTLINLWSKVKVNKNF